MYLLLRWIVIFPLMMATYQISSAALITDFSWVPTTPVNSASGVFGDGTVVSLTTTSIPFYFVPNTTVGPITSILGGSSPQTTVTFSFSRSITNLRLDVHDIDGVRESLTNFSYAPSSVTGDLINNGGVIQSSVENGVGSLLFTNINSSVLSFDYQRVPGLGISLLEMEIDGDVTQVPIPGLSPWLWFSFAGLWIRNHRNL